MSTAVVIDSEKERLPDQYYPLAFPTKTRDPQLPNLARWETLCAIFCAGRATKAEDRSYHCVGRTGLLASTGSFVVEISIQRRICEFSGPSFAKEEEPLAGARSSFTRPTDFVIGGTACFAGKRVGPVAKRHAKLNWDR